MKIVGRNVEDQFLHRTPVYLLTGDLETAKFYSDLASASSKLGYFVEDVVKDFITYPIVGREELGNRTGIYVLVKKKIVNKIPDFLKVDTDNKTVDVYEVKTNLKNLDSKQAFGEKIKHEELKNFLVGMFVDYTVTMYVVDFFEGPSLKVNLYENDTLLVTIPGRQFCDQLNVSFDDVMIKVRESREHNGLFIMDYKSKPLDQEDIAVSHETNLMRFL